MNKLLIAYMSIVTLVSAILAGTMGVLAAGIYIPVEWREASRGNMAGSPRYVTMEPGLTIGEEQGWSEGKMSLAVELISRHDPTIKAVERNMDILRSEIAQGLAEHEPEKFTGTEGRRRLVEDILRLANSTLLAEGESARVEAVRFPAKQVKFNGRSSSNQDLTADL